MLVGNGQLVPNASQYIEVKTKIIDMVIHHHAFDSTYFNTLTLEQLRLKDASGRSLLWWISWAVSQGRFEAFDLIWLKYNESFSYQEFQENDDATASSAQCLLACGAKVNPRPMMGVLQRWSGQLSAKDLRSQAEDGKFKNQMMINALISAAKEHKIKRQVINTLLENVPYICSKEDLSSKPQGHPSIDELISQGVAQNCEWSVKLKRVIEARNAFFEGIVTLTSHPHPGINEFAALERLAQTADKEGYVHALHDADVLICMLNAAQKNEWAMVFNLLKNKASDDRMLTEDVYNALSKIARKATNFWAINQINQHFGRNRQYNHEDFVYQYNSLLAYKDRFKNPTGTFISHALVKRAQEGQPLNAMQFTLQSASNAPTMVALSNVTGHKMPSGMFTYEAVTLDNQKMVSTDTFTIEVQTKVDAVFVCEKYDLIFFAPTSQGTFLTESVEKFNPEGKMLWEKKIDDAQDEIDEECPLVRGGELEISLDDLYMRHIYPDQSKLKERDHLGAEKAIKGKSSDVYKGFYDFYHSFFTEKMLHVAKKTLEGKWLFAPETLHAVAKMFFRPSGPHFNIKNLAVAPKWVNSLMMIIESAVSWHAVHAPFAKLKLKTIFNTFALHHVLKEGTFEGTLKTENTEVKISKELLPCQSNPPFPQITDITQATFVLNCLLNGQPGRQIPLMGLTPEPQKALTMMHDNPAKGVSETPVQLSATVFPIPKK